VTLLKCEGAAWESRPHRWYTTSVRVGWGSVLALAVGLATGTLQAWLLVEMASVLLATRVRSRAFVHRWQQTADRRCDDRTSAAESQPASRRKRNEAV
jgi:hypothetical protein